MADTVTLPGTGAVVATDDVGGVHYQQMKLVESTLDSTAPIGVDSNPLKVGGPDCVSVLVDTFTGSGTSDPVDTKGYGAIVLQISGQWVGQFTVEASNDSAVWDTVLVFSRDSASLLDLITGNGLYTVRPSGRYIRLVSSAITGTASVSALGRAAEGINAADLLSLAMDESNGMPLGVKMYGASGAPVPQDPMFGGALNISPASRVFRGASFSGAAATLIEVPVDGALSATVAIRLASTAAWTMEGLVGGQWGTLLSTAAPTITGNIPAVITVPCGGADRIRVRITGAASGNAILQLSPFPAAPHTVLAASGSAAIVGGNVSEDSSTTAAPVIVGGVLRTAMLAATNTAGDAVRHTMSNSGELIVRDNAVPELTWNYAAASGGILNTTTAVTARTAVASQRGNIKSLQLMAEALGTATEFAIRDGAAGPVLWRTKIPTGGLPSTPFTFDPPLRQAAVNTLIEIVTLTASGTGAVYANLQGFMSN